MAEIKSLQFTDGTEVTPPSSASSYFVKNNFTATTNPSATDDTSGGYSVGSKWINTSTDDGYICVDSTASAAVWDIITPSAVSLSVATKTDDYTTTNADGLILVDAISKDITITLNAVSGNTGQQLIIQRIDDVSEKVDTFVDGDVTVGTDNINITSHPFYDLQKVQLTTTGTLPSGLALATDYYVIKVDSDNIKLASSIANAIADTAVDIVSASGGGTHTITSQATTVTVDGDSADTIDEAANTTLDRQFQSLYIVADGSTNWASANGRHQVDSAIFLHTENGNGSTNTYIRRFTTAVTNMGSAITYSDSASNGALFEINEPGLYMMHGCDLFSSPHYAGISVNSTQLTTSIVSITAADRRALGEGGTGEALSYGTVQYLSPGDKVRVHTSTGTGSSTAAPERANFAIAKIGRV